jgi:hypothetical protein
MKAYKNFDGLAQPEPCLVTWPLEPAPLTPTRSKSGSTQVPRLVH